MLEMIEANWLAFALALLIGLLVAWWLFGRAARIEKARARRADRRPDALDEGAAPAQRNQTLIDAPSAATVAASFAGTGPDIIGGVGEIAAGAAAEEVAEAEAEVAIKGGDAPSPAFAESGLAASGDDLRRIKGVGPKLVVMLQQQGITAFSQIAGWTDADIARVDARLGPFAGRIRRDSWIDQAKFLAADDTAGFEAKFGKL